MVTGSTERGITSQGSMERADSPYRALESSVVLGSDAWCDRGRGWKVCLWKGSLLSQHSQSVTPFIPQETRNFFFGETK